MADEFTNSSINALAARSERYEMSDSVVKGLRIRVSPDGTKTFYILYRHDGQRRRFRLGRYGDLTIAAARNLARTKLGEVAAGTDVQTERKEGRLQAQRDKASTLGAFLDRRTGHTSKPSTSVVGRPAPSSSGSSGTCSASAWTRSPR